ncbi:MAG: hypothetical protein IPI58_06825 [Alphaproteobacteria bacterium]|nr:MAG: hypothetical protein IPI58_06825 [Alphaproteobacteria bacterium]
MADILSPRIMGGVELPVIQGVTFMAPAIPGALAMVNAEALKPENMKRYFEMKGDLDDIGSWPSCLVEAVIKKNICGPIKPAPMPVIGTNGIEFGKFDVPLMIALGVERIAVVVPFGCKKDVGEKLGDSITWVNANTSSANLFADEVRELRSGTSPKEATHLKRLSAAGMAQEPTDGEVYRMWLVQTHGLRWQDKSNDVVARTCLFFGVAVPSKGHEDEGDLYGVRQQAWENWSQENAAFLSWAQSNLLPAGQPRFNRNPAPSRGVLPDWPVASRPALVTETPPVPENKLG